jgi:hypothetical protein
MKFVNQARLSQTGLAGDHHQLTVALPRPIPAPHQQGDFFVATDKRREMALPRATACTACPDEPE